MIVLRKACLMSLYTETTGGVSGRLILSSLGYITTTWLIFMSVCSMLQPLLQKMAHKWWDTKMGDVIFPVDVRSFPYMMSRVTFDFVMTPRRWTLRSQLSTSASISWASPASSWVFVLFGYSRCSIWSFWLWRSSLGFSGSGVPLFIPLCSVFLYDL